MSISVDNGVNHFHLPQPQLGKLDMPLEHFVSYSCLFQTQAVRKPVANLPKQMQGI